MFLVGETVVGRDSLEPSRISPVRCRERAIWIQKSEHGRLGCAATRRLACCLHRLKQARRLFAAQSRRPCSYFGSCCCQSRTSFHAPVASVCHTSRKCPALPGWLRLSE